MRILVDQMPNKPSECPYAITYTEHDCFCNYRNLDIAPRCDYKGKGACRWFKKATDRSSKGNL